MSTGQSRGEHETSARFFQTKFSDIVHYLGGSVRKDYGDQVTHVVSFANLGEKYLVSVREECIRHVYVRLR